MDGDLRLAKLLHSVYLVGIGSIVSLVFRLSRIGISPVFAAGDSLTSVVVVAFGFLSVASLFFAHYLPRSMTRARNRKPGNRRRLAMISFIGGGFCAAVAVYGFVLAVLGMPRYVALPFFVVSFVALIATFPTEARWRRLVQSRV